MATLSGHDKLLSRGMILPMQNLDTTQTPRLNCEEYWTLKFRSRMNRRRGFQRMAKAGQGNDSMGTERFFFSYPEKQSESKPVIHGSQKSLP